MKKLYLIVLLFSWVLLYPDIIEVENILFETKISDNFTELIPESEHLFLDSQEGFPQIPLKAFFFEIPLEKEVKNIEVYPLSIKSQLLQYKIKPINKAVPLSMISNSKNAFINAEIYSKDILPKKWLQTYDGFIKGCYGWRRRSTRNY